jgi:hypothetical protein
MEPDLTSCSWVQSMTLAAFLEIMMWLTHDKKPDIIIDPSDELCPNPITYRGNSWNHAFIVRPLPLAKTVANMSQVVRKIMKREWQLFYDDRCPLMSGIDCIAYYAVHETRHTLQSSLRHFNPNYQEINRGYLGVSLDINKQKLISEPGHFNQSGQENIVREFDAEVIALYLTSLWRDKTEEQMKTMLVAEPE